MTIVGTYIFMENSTCGNTNQLKQVQNRNVYNEKLGCNFF